MAKPATSPAAAQPAAAAAAAADAAATPTAAAAEFRRGRPPAARDAAVSFWLEAGQQRCSIFTGLGNQGTRQMCGQGPAGLQEA